MTEQQINKMRATVAAADAIIERSDKYRAAHEIIANNTVLSMSIHLQFSNGKELTAYNNARSADFKLEHGYKTDEDIIDALALALYQAVQKCAEEYRNL